MASTKTQADHLRDLKTPAAAVGFEPAAVSEPLAAALWNGASGANWTAGQKGQRGLSITYDSWSWNVVVATPSTPKRRFWRNPDGPWDEPARWVLQPNNAGHYASSLIPWDPAWRIPAGTDLGMIIVDGDKKWWVLGTKLDPAWWIKGSINWRTTDWSQWWKGGKYGAGDAVGDNFGYTTPATEHLAQGRGPGHIPKHYGILTPTMVRDGIDQALSVVIVNAQYGAGATWRSPATRVEHKSAASRGKLAAYLPQGNVASMVPGGLRWTWDIAPSEIRRRADDLPVGLRGAAISITEALVEYGAFEGETGDGGWQIESCGALTPESKELWASLGMTTGAQFGSLLTPMLRGPEEIRIVKAETSTL